MEMWWKVWILRWFLRDLNTPSLFSLLLGSFCPIDCPCPREREGKATRYPISLPRARDIYFLFFPFLYERDAPFLFCEPRARHRHRNMPVSEPPYTRDLSPAIEFPIEFGEGNILSAAAQTARWWGIGWVIFCPLLHRQLDDGELVGDILGRARRPCSHAVFFLYCPWAQHDRLSK